MEELERVYKAALDAIQRGEPAAVATVIEAQGSTPRKAGAKMLVYADGRTVGSVGGGVLEARVIEEARDALTDGRSRELHYRPHDRAGDSQDVCGGDMRFFVEVLLTGPALLIIGAGHIGQALAEQGALLGYHVTVLDERAELVTAERFPQAHRLLCGSLAEQWMAVSLTGRTYAVLVTPHHAPDEQALAVLAEHSVAYVGLLGSRRRTQSTFERARALGVTDEFLARVHTPIGLNIGAETPREIAVSILAEIIAVQRGRE